MMIFTFKASRSHLSFSFCALLLASCMGSQPSNNVSATVEVEELNSGISESTTIYKEEMPDSPSGLRNFSGDFRIVVPTDTMPAHLGQQFGIVFQLNSDVAHEVEVEQVWKFPSPIIFPDGKVITELRYNIVKPTDEPTYSFYELENQYEVVKGVWIYEMFHNGNKIFEKKFYLK
jgi:hypothetical protein